MDKNNPFSEVSFVMCLESGPIEEMTTRLVESLRRFGGRAAHCRAFCVCPRRGPALLASTRARLRAAGAEVIECGQRLRYSWYQYLNKWIAAKVAEQHVDGGSLVFLDSDVLVMGEPAEFCLPNEIDFAALPEVYSSTNPPPYEADFWQALCETVGAKWQDLAPIILSDGTATPQYWNGGVVAFRCGCGLPDQIIADVITALDQKVARTAEQVHFIEQRMIGISAVKRSLCHRSLSISHNANIDTWNVTPDKAGLSSARILHYHGVMEKKWDWMLELLSPAHPSVSDWLSDRYSALKERRPFFRRTQSEIYRIGRSMQRRLYVSRGVVEQRSARNA